MFGHEFVCIRQSDVSSVIKDEVSCHMSQTPVGLQICKSFLEIEAKAEVSRARTLLVH